MKKIIFTLFIMGSVWNLWAQSGRITFKETIKLDIKLDGEQSEQFASLLPKENTSEKMLTFTPKLSLYENVVKDDDAPAESEGGVVIKFNQGDDKVFFDLETMKRIEQKDFMGRMFLIESDADTLKWKMTGNQKNILGYNCMEATVEKKNNKITAWFAPEIPVSSGPGSLHGLPGMILETDVNNGEKTVVATNIETGDINSKTIVKPKKGKKVTKDEFDKIVEEKNKEMGIEPGKPGTVKMKIITR